MQTENVALTLSIHRSSITSIRCLLSRKLHISKECVSGPEAESINTAPPPPEVPRRQYSTAPPPYSPSTAQLSRKLQFVNECVPGSETKSAAFEIHTECFPENTDSESYAPVRISTAPPPSCSVCASCPGSCIAVYYSSAGTSERVLGRAGSILKPRLNALQWRNALNAVFLIPSSPEPSDIFKRLKRLRASRRWGTAPWR